MCSQYAVVNKRLYSVQDESKGRVPWRAQNEYTIPGTVEDGPIGLGKKRHGEPTEAVQMGDPQKSTCDDDAGQHRKRRGATTSCVHGV